MRRRVCAQAIIVLGLATGGCVLSIAPGSTLMGVGSAEAAAFYTRKRVNGRWITGQFPKAGTRVARASSSTRFARKSRRVVEEFAVAAAPQPPVREHGPSPSVALPQRTEAVKTPESAKQAVSFQPAAEFSEERTAKLRRALQARADELAAAQTASIAARVASTEPAVLPPSYTETAQAVATAPGPVSETSAPVRQGPTEMAGAASAAPAKATTRDPLEPRSVSYDFETGIKTTVFASSVVREPFDVSALKGMTGRLPPLR